MDPHVVARDLQRSREKLRAVMLSSQSAGGAGPDVFPRSNTMRFLLDPHGRQWATMLLGGVASIFLGRRAKARRAPSRPPALARSVRALLGTALRR